MNYFGNNLTTDEYDELAIGMIDLKFLKDEKKLYETKWFDYRHLHPTNATYLFSEHYDLEYKKVYQKIKDVEVGKYIRGSKGKDVMLKKEVTGFWKARQSADRLGIPYDRYISMSIRFLIEGNIWQRIPRPVHLYSKKVIDHVSAEWEEVLNAGIIEPEISHLSDDNDFTRQCKRDIARWLCMHLKNRKQQHFGLSFYCFEKNLIPEDLALEYFSVETIEKAKKFLINR